MQNYFKANVTVMFEKTLTTYEMWDTLKRITLKSCGILFFGCCFFNQAPLVTQQYLASRILCRAIAPWYRLTPSFVKSKPDRNTTDYFRLKKTIKSNFLHTDKCQISITKNKELWSVHWTFLRLTQVSDSLLT